MAEEAAVVAIEELDQPESGEKEHRRELTLFNQIAPIIAPSVDLQVINEDRATALSHLKAIVQAARCRTSQLWSHLAPRYLHNNS